MNNEIFPGALSFPSNLKSVRSISSHLLINRHTPPATLKLGKGNKLNENVTFYDHLKIELSATAALLHHWQIKVEHKVWRRHTQCCKQPFLYYVCVKLIL